MKINKIVVIHYDVNGLSTSRAKGLEREIKDAYSNKFPDDYVLMYFPSTTEGYENKYIIEIYDVSTDKTELIPESKQVKDITMSDRDLYLLVREELSKLCKTGGKSLTMTVPPKEDDTDMLISELLNRFKDKSNFKI